MQLWFDNGLGPECLTVMIFSMMPKNSLQKEQISTGNKILFIFAPPPWRRDLLSLSEIVFWMMKEWGSGVNGKYCISWWHMMIGMVHFGFGDRCQSYPVLSYVVMLVFHIVDHGDCIWIWSYQKIVYWWWKKCYTKFLPYCPVLSYAELVFP